MCLAPRPAIWRSCPRCLRGASDWRFLTPAVVAGAVGAAPGGRAGLASAVSNTARQALGAVGIAAFGALAGQPSGRGFMAGFHLAAIIATGVFLVAAILTARYIRAGG